MSENHPKRILIIEDDPHIAEGLALNLALQGHDVVRAHNGTSGLQRWRETRPHLIILDIMLPGIDGLAVLQAVRLEDERLPILILSARTASDDVVKGLSYGVDDYLTKPFNLDEFLLRVDRLLKRGGWSAPDTPPEGDTAAVYTFGGNTIDFRTNTARCRQGILPLTVQEARLLKLFTTNSGKPLSRGKLLEVGWGYTRKVSSRTVDNFIVRLRKYFEDNPKKPKYFKSIRSVGYVFDPDGR